MLAGVAGAALLGVLVFPGAATREFEGARLWIADRGAGRLVGADRMLRPLGSCELPGLESVLGTSRGELWIVAEDGALLLREDARGHRARWRIPEPARLLDLAEAQGGGILVLVAEGSRRVVRVVRGTGVGSALVVPDGAMGLASGPRGALVYGERGVWALDVRGSVPTTVAVSRVGARDAGAVSGETGEGAFWWRLRPDGTQLDLLGAGLEPRRSVLLPLPMSSGAVDENRIWLAARGRTRLFCVDLPSLEISPDRVLDPGLSSKVVAATPLPDGGGLTLALPGALLRMTPRGRLVGSQGGFRGIVSLAISSAPHGAASVPGE
ncbi:MAG TPA: hypothetical protein ENJ09_04280 [Planctomycetes bacterium]|nr:hypothetical protein [Planctomycetota bacterium]